MRKSSRFREIRLSAVLLVIGCGPDIGRVAPDQPALATATAANDRFGQWQSPRLIEGVNSPSNDIAPELSKDGLSLYFASNRPGGLGANDLYVARRASIDAPWGSPVNLTMLNSAFGDAGPHLSRDGHYLYFTSSRLTGGSGNDIYVTWRADVHDDFAWGPPENIGAPVNTAQSELGPSSWGPEFYFWRGPPTPTSVPGDIYLSRMIGVTFTDPEPVVELNSAAHDEKPGVRFDGREIYLSSERGGGSGGADVWFSTRRGNGQEWATPTNAGATINSAANDRRPSLSPDATILLFDSNRPGGPGAIDLYMSTREKSAPRE